MPSKKQTDTRLILALVAGDQAALVTLISEWERPLYSFIFRYTQNDQTTKDLLQETFIRVYQKCHRYKPEYPFSSWIFTIAANLCRNHARWKRRHPEISYEEVTEPNEDSGERSIHMPKIAASVQEHTQGNNSLELLKEVVGELPHDLKTVVLLKHYDAMSYEEISQIVGCSERGVETRLYRARKLLKKRMAAAMLKEEART